MGQFPSLNALCDIGRALNPFYFPPQRSDPLENDFPGWLLRLSGDYSSSGCLSFSDPGDVAFVLRACAAAHSAHMDGRRRDAEREADSSNNGGKKEDGGNDASEADTDEIMEHDNLDDFGKEGEVEVAAVAAAAAPAAAAAAKQPKLRKTKSKVRLMKDDLKLARQVNARYNRERYGLRPKFKRTASMVFRCTRPGCSYYSYQMSGLNQHRQKYRH